MFERIISALRGQTLPRVLPLPAQKSRRAQLQHQIVLQGALPSRQSTLSLLNKAQVQAILILPTMIHDFMIFRYVTALSIDSELTGNGSVIDASEGTRLVVWTQMVLAKNTSKRSRGVTCFPRTQI